MDHIEAASLSPIHCAVRVNKQRENRQWIFMVYMAKADRLEVALPNNTGKPDADLTEDDLDDLTEDFDPKIAGKFKDWLALFDDSAVM